ncbi:pyrroline-5-carboxylate reductase [Sphingoaurantiacus capsulatus]|uniref:Pyrroline-5-carboxylate reductase n=1 Tax=Sphingoaurantiacus capsulatus TaxID=1771310 RepID=A0ABV7XDG3_9SPHN
MDAPRLDRIGTLWVVGCGNMGSALLTRWIACGVDPEHVVVIDPGAKDVPAGIRVVATAAEAGRAPDIVLLAIKPQLLAEVAPTLTAHFDNPLILSILAGARLATLGSLSLRVIRAMPNTPARIGEGTTVLCGGVPEDRGFAEALMATAGAVHWIDDESLFDAVTGVSGSGPAYVFRFIEALAAAATAAGLPAETAQALALETVTGAAALAALRESSPAELRKQVTSPNGTTAAGLAVLDGDGSLTALLAETVAAAAARSAELASAASPAIPGSSAGPAAG